MSEFYLFRYCMLRVLSVAWGLLLASHADACAADAYSHDVSVQTVDTATPDTIASNTLIDSLQNKLRQSGLAVADRILCLNQLAREFAYVSSTQAATYAQRALELSLQANDLSGQAYAYRNLASIYSVQESFYLSLEFTTKALDIFEQLKDSVGMGNCYITLGHTYKRQQDYIKAIGFHQQAVAIFRQRQLPERLAVSLHNLGEAYLLHGMLDQARLHTGEAIRLCRVLNNQSLLSACLRVLGAIAYRENDYAEAQKYFARVIQISNQLGPNAQYEATTESLIYMARLAGKNKQKTQEIVYLRQAIQLAKVRQYPQFLRMASQMAERYYLERGDLLAAQQFFDQYEQVVDQIYRWQNRDKVAMIETVLSTLKLSEQNRNLSVQAKKGKQTIARQQELIYWTTFCFVLVSVSLGGFIYYYQQRRQLLQQIVSQNAIIAQTAQKLERINQAKNKFFKIVAHDLVSPLSSMSGVAELLSEDINALDKQELEFIMKQWKQNLQATLNLAHNLINWAHSQMDANPPQFRPVQVYPLLEKVQSVYQAIAWQKEIDLQIESAEDPVASPAAHPSPDRDSLQIHADSNQVEFVLRNLINNAIKFTPRHGRITLRIQHDTGYITFLIRDTGLGMSAEQTSGLFSIDKLRRTQGTDGEPGSGMGLVLCQEFVTKNNGHIWVESHVGTGTIFGVRFPKHL